MPALTRHFPLRVLIVRATWLFVLITIVVSAARVDSSIGVVLLVAILGVIDIRRRHETVLWANLGYSAWHTAGVFALTAITFETVFMIAVLPLIHSMLGRTR